MRRSAAPLALLAAASTAAAQNSTITCVDGLYVIVARGTGEAKGPGITGLVANNVTERIDDSKVLGLDYPATFTDPSYFDSVHDGGVAMSEAVTAYHQKCPDGKIAVLGYSQGAQITLNAFCGGSEIEEDLTPLSASVYNDSVVAIVLFGDPSHNADAPYNNGTSTKDGIFARNNITLCEDLGPRLVSFCDKRDQYCDSQNEQNEVHGSYVQHYGDDAVDFIVSRYEEAADATSTATTTVVSTATETSGSTPTGEEGAATPTSEGGSGAADVVPGFGLLGLGLAALALL